MGAGTGTRIDRRHGVALPEFTSRLGSTITSSLLWLRLLTLGLFLGLWFLLTELEVWDPLILPRPSSVWNACVQSVTTDGRRRGLRALGPAYR